ncbi:hypothetical protein Q5P01_014961 [Channa striata]|uniref:Uncharacterized protein n=1 Tax=Channa striata TaxID=64152 RepID=A0AA88MHC2_CHASR|nr:hypothetical protein Q5P01_014961 [Channa striata]
MHRLISILLLAVGACDTVYWQTLTCPYKGRHETLTRIWCRQTSTECCTGLLFSHTDHLVDGGKLKVTQGIDSFTVEAAEPVYGEGQYWCGMLTKNKTIIKLAEGYFHTSYGAFIWNFTRWILLPLLPMVTIFTSLCYRTTTKCISKKAKKPYDETAMRGARIDPQYENATSFFELERRGFNCAE